VTTADPTRQARMRASTSIYNHPPMTANADSSASTPSVMSAA
jgi:hypothetical protein